MGEHGSGITRISTVLVCWACSLSSRSSTQTTPTLVLRSPKRHSICRRGCRPSAGSGSTRRSPSLFGGEGVGETGGTGLLPDAIIGGSGGKPPRLIALRAPGLTAPAELCLLPLEHRSPHVVMVIAVVRGHGLALLGHGLALLGHGLALLGHGLALPGPNHSSPPGNSIQASYRGRRTSEVCRGLRNRKPWSLT